MAIFVGGIISMKINKVALNITQNKSIEASVRFFLNSMHKKSCLKRQL
jgi:hypothetical protein